MAAATYQDSHSATALATALLELAEERNELDVTDARALDDRQLDEVRQRVSAAIQKQAIVKQHVDESILGGIVIRFGDKLIDGSVRSQLKAIEDRMLAATV
jgi:F-type H+-transporting ATPase subunit delta